MLKVTRRDCLKSIGALACLSLPRSMAICMNDNSSVQDSWAETGIAVSELACFDHAMKTFMQERSIPGGSLAIASCQKLVFARGYSTVDDGIPVLPQSLFRIASLTKPITAAAVLQLVESKKLSLSDKIVEVLPKNMIGNDFSDDRMKDITVLHLLQHLGGWCRDESFDAMLWDRHIAKERKIDLPISKQDVISFMNTKPLQYKPGTKYAYSNYGYMLLGKAIETVTGQSYSQYVKENLFFPLGIKNAELGRTEARYRLDGEVKYYSRYSGLSVLKNDPISVPLQYGGFNIENMDAHGGWVMSVIDMLRFARAFDQPDKCPILSEASLDRMFGVPEYFSGKPAPEDTSYYGCGWTVRKLNQDSYNSWHNGSLPGTQTILVRRDRGNLSWCVLFNQRDDASGLDYYEIDQRINEVADTVKSWPDHDFFDEYR